MLILTRRSGETIRIGNDVSVTVLGITGQQARIGISAPESVAVHREEIHRRIQAGIADKSVLSPTEAHAQFIEDHLGKLPVDQQPMHIDDRVQMAANARRYEWLREAARVNDAEDSVVAGRGIHYLFSEDLDREIDGAMRLEAMGAAPCVQ